jgi:hypothetical protein
MEDAFVHSFTGIYYSYNCFNSYMRPSPYLLRMLMALLFIFRPLNFVFKNYLLCKRLDL